MKVPAGADLHEFNFNKGFSDGLPVVPCTQEKLEAMLAGTHLSPSEVLGRMPPALAKCTVSNVAANAVMAGCEPRHLQVVVAAVRAMLEPAFNLHGVHATTMGATPAVIVNGASVARSAGLNSKHGALGSGQNNRANACIGRALKLVIQNCGRAALGGTESTTLGGPRKFTLCICENSEVLEKLSPPWQPFRGDGDDVITVHAVSNGADQLVDSSASAGALVDLLGAKISHLWSPLVPKISECLVVICPEHYKTLHAAGVTSKARLRHMLFDAANAHYNANALPRVARMLAASKKVPFLGRVVLVLVAHAVRAVVSLLNALSPAAGHDGVSCTLVALAAATVVATAPRRSIAALGIAAALALKQAGLLRPIARRLAGVVPKLASPESLHIVVTGSEAGKFSSVMPGFGMAAKGTAFKLSECVTVPVPPTPPAVLQAPSVTSKSNSKSDSRDGVFLVDPRGVQNLGILKQAPRKSEKSKNKSNKTVGLLDISKGGGADFLGRIQELLGERGWNVRRYTKPSFGRQCPTSLREQIAKECNAVLCALAD